MADKKKPTILPWGMNKDTLQPNSVKVSFDFSFNFKFNAFLFVGDFPIQNKGVQCWSNESLEEIQSVSKEEGRWRQKEDGMCSQLFAGLYVNFLWKV